MKVHTLFRKCSDLKKLFGIYSSLFPDDTAADEDDFGKLCKELVSLEIKQADEINILYVIPYYESNGDYRTREVFKKHKNDVRVYDGKNFYPIMFTDKAVVMGFEVSEKTLYEMDGYDICAHIIYEIACWDDDIYISYTPSGRIYTDDEKKFMQELAEKDVSEKDRIINAYLEIAEQEFITLREGTF